MINKENISYYMDGEDITALVLNRPIEQLEANIDNLIALTGDPDPFPQYNDVAIVYAIALG